MIVTKRDGGEKVQNDLPTKVREGGLLTYLTCPRVLDTPYLCNKRQSSTCAVPASPARPGWGRSLVHVL